MRSGIPSSGRLTNFNSRKIERPDKAKDRPRRDSISAKTFSIKSPSYSGKHTFYTVTGRLIIYSYPKVKIEQDHDWEYFPFQNIHLIDWIALGVMMGCRPLFWFSLSPYHCNSSTLMPLTHAKKQSQSCWFAQLFWFVQWEMFLPCLAMIPSFGLR